ncbi:hypothetical protein GCM10010168_69830 [Actinoplanes ianthinogenes]|uniref:Uncharacterized protein n=1 Tax=Actinoplanes ianthinogenes TaxID=122358 RepID=A0ABM7M0U7_9ACTN|nr:hypothetical protein [Actinoplanes ianthinogenes]BCJ45182.1 hypothetical protein Aiant_58390 [Actinoplanes ianthinogenes]GGR41119.1 hypothetical protein GCM10010168_69830 [Actinoplanes ianthinogenes]
MGEFVQIRTSPASLIEIGHSMQRAGRDLENRVDEIRNGITSHENARALPEDKYTDEYRKKYFEEITDSEGTTSKSNEAVVKSCRYCGTMLIRVGETVANAMVNYQSADEDAAGDIRKAL